jgi:hypothetical protein
MYKGIINWAFVCFFVALAILGSFYLAFDKMDSSPTDEIDASQIELYGITDSRAWVYNYLRVIKDLESIEPGLGKKFADNALKDLQNDGTGYTPDLVLLSAFSWKESPEGSEYWAEVSSKVLEKK